MATVGPPTSMTDGQPIQPTLRVMRLFNPKLATTSVLPYCPYADALHGGTEAGPINAKSLRPVTDESSFVLGNSVMLPDNFGAIFLGETFSGYISVVNQLPRTVLKQVVVQARLACPNSKIEESEARFSRGGEPLPKEAVPELHPGQNLEMIVERLLTEVGNYHLRVSVTYTPFDAATGRQGQAETMRKVYRFAVQNPLQVATKCIGVGGVPHAEIQIRNTAKVLLCLEGVDFLPEEGYIAELIKTENGEEMSQSEQSEELSAVQRYDRSKMLAQEAAYQVVYKILRADGQTISRPHPAVIEVPLGQLNISWTTAMGEKGRMITSPISYKLPSVRDVEVKLEGLPAKFILGQAAAVCCLVINRTEKPLSLQMQFRLDAMVGVYVAGKSFRNLGILDPGQSIKCDVELIPTVGGLHPFRGIYVIDLQTQQEYDQGKLCDIFVETSEK